MKESKLVKRFLFHGSSFRCFSMISICLLAAFVERAYCQAELEPWGNLRGIRIDGQLMGIETGIRLVGKGWTSINATAKEKQRPLYAREGNAQVVTSHLDSLYFVERVEDKGKGTAVLQIVLTAKAELNMEGAYFVVDLPAVEFPERTVRPIDPKDGMPASGVINADGSTEFIHTSASGVELTTANRQFELKFNEPGLLIARKEKGKPGAGDRIVLYMPVQSGNLHSGDGANRRFTIKASGEIDKDTVGLVLNPALSGRSFDGFGGNFRLQNPAMDPQVIDYCLKNMRVAWGRVEMPWAFWQPDKVSDPIDSAKAGRLNPRVVKAMEMAQRLSKMDIPIILSAWFPPRWAIVGSPNFRPRADGVWGNPLNVDNMSEIYKSIADYIDYLHSHYGVEVKCFSFNESDLGINVRQTAEEHDALIKGLGAYLLGRGLKTKMLLGDNSDANSYSFIDVALADAAARPYIGAISFHSWRGWEKETLQKWAAAATRLDLPLIVAEGSIDAAAWNYPGIFLEPAYALDEINLYVRILSICQPLSILQWQLTSDYSPLTGGGLFGNNAPLAPTQRFWNLKQLASTPKGLSAMPITCDKPNITCAALGNNNKRIFSIHLVNTGATREATLKGLPKKLKMLRLFMTDKDSAMKEGTPVAVTEGEAHFTLGAGSYTTLVSD